MGVAGFHLGSRTPEAAESKSGNKTARVSVTGRSRSVPISSRLLCGHVPVFPFGLFVRNAPPQNQPNVMAATAKYRAVLATATMATKIRNGSRNTPATIVRGSPMKGSQLRSRDQRP